MFPTDWKTPASVLTDGIVSRKGSRKDGWRSAPTHIILVWGPPAAGKTTYVDKHKQPGDIVVDYDRLAEALGATAHQETPGQRTVTNKARNAVLDVLRDGSLDVSQAWIVSSNPNALSVFPHHEATLIDPGPEQTHQQANNAGRLPRWHDLIDQWYAQNTSSQPASDLAPRNYLKRPEHW